VVLRVIADRLESYEDVPHLSNSHSNAAFLKSTGETAYLFRSPENAKRPKESIKSYQNGTGKEQALVEDE